MPGRQRQTPLFNPKIFLQEQYCYTNGLCAYSSKDCRTPGPTHNVQATAKNTMGGAAAKRRAKWTWRCGVELKKVCTITTTDFKSNFIYQSLAQQPLSSASTHTINADTGTTGNFLASSDLTVVLIIKPAVNGISIALPDDQVIISTHTTTLKCLL
jgi:hypothetical protein